MEFDLDAILVTHNEEARRFEATVNGLLAFLTYHLLADRMVLPHTEVPPLLEGRGLAAKLTRAALDFARDRQLRVVPHCPYVADFLRKNGEYQDLVAPGDLQKILSSQ